MRLKIDKNTKQCFHFCKFSVSCPFFPWYSLKLYCIPKVSALAVFTLSWNETIFPLGFKTVAFREQLTLQLKIRAVLPVIDHFPWRLQFTYTLRRDAPGFDMVRERKALFGSLPVPHNWRKKATKGSLTHAGSLPSMLLKFYHSGNTVRHAPWPFI